MDEGKFRAGVRRDHNGFLLRGKTEFLRHILDQLADAERFPLDCDVLCLQFRQGEEIGNQFSEAGAMGDGNLEVLPALFSREHCVAHQEGFHVPLECRQRCPEIV